jgi:HD-GYP domain-containing protein (c-di-GMP phosphodiesterase class II)
MYRPLPLDSFALHEPVPVNIWDAKGVLLLRKGETITSEQHRGVLLLHAPVVLASDWQALNYGYTASLDRMVRDNQALNRIAGLRALSASPAEVAARNAGVSVPEAWAELHATLAALLHQGASAHQFLERVLRVQSQGEQLWHDQADNSLLVLVQLLFDTRVSYSATHALLAAGLCALVAPLAGLDEKQRRALVLAALTMNLGMTREHDEMARQPGPLSSAQRKVVREHPQQSVALLRQLGVLDAEWIRLVAQHHEKPDGTGYPKGERVDRITHRLLQMADVYVACISPRKSRGALLSQQVARELYMGGHRAPDQLGALFVKSVGFYPPGSYVRLASGELGVVVRRGEKANEPRVAALVGRQGLPLGEPVLRDTADPTWAVAASLPPGEVKVIVNVDRLIARG